MIPPGPVAATTERSTPRSLARLRTGGLASTAASDRRAPSSEDATWYPAPAPPAAPVEAPFPAAAAAVAPRRGGVGRPFPPCSVPGLPAAPRASAGAPAPAGAVRRRRRATGASFVP